MRISAVVTAVATMVMVTSPARSSEFFICKDGRTIAVNASNRRQLMADPCIAEWFELNAKRSGKASKAATPQSMTGGKGSSRGSSHGGYDNDPYYDPYSYGYSPWFY